MALLVGVQNWKAPYLTTLDIRFRIYEKKQIIHCSKNEKKGPGSSISMVVNFVRRL